MSLKILFLVAYLGSRINHWALSTLVQRKPFASRWEWVGQVAGWNNEILGCLWMDYEKSLELKKEKAVRKTASR